MRSSDQFYGINLQQKTSLVCMAQASKDCLRKNFTLFDGYIVTQLLTGRLKQLYGQVICIKCKEDLKIDRKSLRSLKVCSHPGCRPKKVWYEDLCPECDNKNMYTLSCGVRLEGCEERVNPFNAYFTYNSVPDDIAGRDISEEPCCATCASNIQFFLSSKNKYSRGVRKLEAEKYIEWARNGLPKTKGKFKDNRLRKVKREKKGIIRSILDFLKFLVLRR